MIALFRSEFRVYAVRGEPEGDRLKAELRTPIRPCGDDWTQRHGARGLYANQPRHIPNRR